MDKFYLVVQSRVIPALSNMPITDYRLIIKNDFEFCVRKCHQMAQHLQDHNEEGFSLIRDMETREIVYQVTITNLTEDILEPVYA